MVELVLEWCKENPAIEEVYLHVQTSNQEAIRFYQKFGFQIEREIKGYYKKIEPPDCYLLNLKVKKNVSSK